MILGAGADPDVAEPGVVLDGPGGAEGGPIVADQADVQVGGDGPGLERAEELGPGGVGAGEAAEDPGQVAADPGDGGAGGGEAEGEVAAVEPRLPEDGRDGAVFEGFQPECWGLGATHTVPTEIEG